MWWKKNKSILLILVVLSLFSCKKEVEDINVLNSVDFGEADYYKPFLFCKKELTPLDKTFRFEFNDEAQKENSFVELSLYDRKTNQPVTSSVVSILKDGEEQKGNKFTISANDEEMLTLGLLFDKNADSDNYQWLFRVSASSLDRISNITLENQDEEIAVLLISAKFNKRINPLLLGIIIFLIVVVGALLIWWLVIRKALYPTFKVGAVTILEPYYNMYKLSSYRKVVFTNKAEKQSTLSKTFQGKILYAVNEIWIDKWELLPYDRNSIKAVSNSNYLIEPFTGRLNKNYDYTVTNVHTNTKIKLKIN